MWKRYRRIIGIAQACVIIGLPFIRIRGESALRFDIPNLKLHFFGTVVWINEFYLFLLAVIFLLLLIISLTTILGRVWCGWLCPQTVLLDLSGDVAKGVPARRSSLVQKIVLIPLSALVSLTLIWYFVPPHETLSALFRSNIITGFFFVQWFVIYAELAFLGRTFCTTICPYSMLQSGLFDSKTLVIAFDGSRKESCMGCDKCMRVCPVGIDIKDGIRRECIACAECIDACTSMTGMVNKPSFVNYTGTVFRPKAFVLIGVTVIIGLLLVITVHLRPDVAFVIIREAPQPVADINRYRYTLQNNTGRDLTLELSIQGDFLVIGETSISLKPYARIQRNVMLKRAGKARNVRFLLKGDGIQLERQVGFL